MIDIEIIDESNKYRYKKFEEVFNSDLSKYQSRIYPNFQAEKIKWYYIKYNNEYIGSIWLEKPYECNYADLGIFIAYDKYRNKGIGMHVIKQILEKTNDLYIEEVRLRVRKNNERAKKCYHKIGFVDSKEFAKDNGITVIEMIYKTK